MKTIFAKVYLAAVVAVAPMALHGQNSQAIVYGRATVVLSPTVLQQFAGLNITVTNLMQERMQNGTNVLPALEGAIDLDTSFNEVVYGGGFQFTSGNNVVQIRNLTLDLMGPSAIFYGIVLKNGTFVGREAIFSIVATGAPSLPIVPVNGTISHDGLSLSFEQPFISTINSIVGNSGLSAASTVGTLDLYSVLAPLSPPVRSWPGPGPW